ncbi:polysaccharide deacetylase family protein [Granulicella aggregans]|uniref:polysaccharide deacetylase family protein n=1 Tax=Granulicella aggregans TaxID=474949 RepID=UPI001C84CEDC
MLVGCWLLAGVVAAQGQMRSVAITVDDLPCANCAPMNADGTPRHGVLVETNRKLVAGLVKAGAPVTGFVITRTAEEAGKSGHEALDLWLDAGFDLGSHSYSHPNFSEISAEEMETEIARADSYLYPLLAAKGKKVRFFRFPYNSTGDTQAKHDSVAEFLKVSNYGHQVAACTIDNSDYVFAGAYAVAVGKNDMATAEKIRREYLAYSATKIDFYAALNRRVLGYEPPEVMLLHDSLLNADSVRDVLELFRKRGYKFVSLSEAQSDPAYAIPDTYVTKYGPMWGYRWAQEKKLGQLWIKEEEPEEWVEKYANGDATGVPGKP